MINHQASTHFGRKRIMIENTKLIKTCNTTRRIVKGLRIFLYVVIAIFIVASVLMYLPAFREYTASIPVEDTLTNTEITYTRDEVLAKGTWAISAVAIGSVVMLLCERILGTVNTENTPFVAENVRRLKIMSVLMAVISVVPSWLAQIVSFILGDRNLLMEVELGMLMIALVIWCLALIFEYGVTLQQREDETL
ncbi:MAG: DUF2975 domain-containing protein [Ruminococcaceae bacterium]|nr:DUF2975 domain-containing protein [Oscillospiraceae bacterium]